MKLILAYLRFHHMAEQSKRQGIMRLPDVVAVELQLSREFTKEYRAVKLLNVN